jgi:hypothetical protein
LKYSEHIPAYVVVAFYCASTFLDVVSTFIGLNILQVSPAGATILETNPIASNNLPLWMIAEAATGISIAGLTFSWYHFGEKPLKDHRLLKTIARTTFAMLLISFSFLGANKLIAGLNNFHLMGWI